MRVDDLKPSDAFGDTLKELQRSFADLQLKHRSWQAGVPCVASPHRGGSANQHDQAPTCPPPLELLVGCLTCL